MGRSAWVGVVRAVVNTNKAVCTVGIAVAT